MVECPQLTTGLCRLIALDVAPPCAACRRQWRRGEPPTATSPTPAIRYVAKHPPPPRPAVAPPPKPPTKRRRKPRHCDHSGKRLRFGPTCETSVYACDLHGEVTCDRCAECGDFVSLANTASRVATQQPADANAAATTNQ